MHLEEDVTALFVLGIVGNLKGRLLMTLLKLKLTSFGIVLKLCGYGDGSRIACMNSYAGNIYTGRKF